MQLNPPLQETFSRKRGSAPLRCFVGPFILAEQQYKLMKITKGVRTWFTRTA